MGYTINTNKNPVTYNAAELSVWQSRITYKSWNDAFTGSPPSYDEMDARASYFIANQSLELVNYDVSNVDGSQRNCAYAVASAFKYLVEGNTTHGNAVKNLILTQIGYSATDFSTYNYLTCNFTYTKFSASWVFKMFLCYEYTLALYSASEKTSIETWFYNAALFYQRFHHIRIITNGLFQLAYYDGSPYADYATMIADTGSHTSGKEYHVLSTNSNWAYNGSTYTEKFTPKEDYTSYKGNTGTTGLYTHIDNTSANVNLIYNLAANWNNSHGMIVRVFSAIGIRLSDTYMQNVAKSFVNEWLKYAVFPDGTTGEYRRNLGTPTDAPQLGTMFYSLICIEQALIVADLFRRQDDNSVYTYSTSEGYQTTAGGTKNIKLVLDTLLEHITSEYDTANAKYALSKTTDRLLSEYRVSTNYRYIPEHIFLLANLYYNDSNYQNCYKLQASNQVAFASSQNRPSAESYGSGPTISWGGALGNYPAAYFMMAEMENVSLAPIANAGSDQSISVATSVLDGTGSYDSGGTITSYLWEQVSGPNTSNILTPTQSTSIVNNLIVGDYIFRLTVTDNDGLSDTDTVTITVNTTVSAINANARVLIM